MARGCEGRFEGRFGREPQGWALSLRQATHRAFSERSVKGSLSVLAVFSASA